MMQNTRLAVRRADMQSAAALMGAIAGTIYQFGNAGYIRNWGAPDHWPPLFKPLAAAMFMAGAAHSNANGANFVITALATLGAFQMARYVVGVLPRR